MPSIRKGLLQLVFSGSFMKRWNDKMRPMELQEVDKQAHKMIAAWILYQLNGKGGDAGENAAMGTEIIEGGIFEYFYRLIITDIKPPVFYRIKSNPSHYQQLTGWVLEQLQPRVQTMGTPFWERLTNYFSHPDESRPARQILEAAHLIASKWEFHLIKDLNPWDEEMEEIEANFQQDLARFGHLRGVAELNQGPEHPLGRFLTLCGQLRFQKRWSQTPRIPETSVLGHMFIVACYAYFLSLTVKASPQRSQNDFFAGLFHDLPEMLTRDIISPVKRSVQHISDLIKEYEDQETRTKVYDLLEQGGYPEISSRLGYYLGVEVGSEFATTIVREGRVVAVSWEEMQSTYNRDEFDPKDGYLLKICDSLAAFIEAYTALRNGITSDHLQQAVWRIRSEYGQLTSEHGLHIGSLLADFD